MPMISSVTNAFSSFFFFKYYILLCSVCYYPDFIRAFYTYTGKDRFRKWQKQTSKQKTL